MTDFFLCASVVRLEAECAHYRMIADEAYKQLMEIQGRDILSQSLDTQLQDWMELMEEVGLTFTLFCFAWGRGGDVCVSVCPCDCMCKKKVF